MLRADALSLLLLALSLLLLRLGLLRLILLIRGLALLLLRLGALALHVDAAAEVRAFGDRDARRGDVAIHRTIVANVDFSDAVTLPVTSPCTTTAFAKTSALILPLGPIVRTLPFRSMRPSTWPSMVRSSLPLNSPLMTTDLPIFTMSLPNWARGSLAAGAAAAATGVAAAGAEAGGAAGLTDSSRFHIVENLPL
jgi:hypothetical protein